MRRSRLLFCFALLCVVGLIVTAAFGAVVGTRQTRIISPPGGSPSADGPSDALPGMSVVPYTFDGPRPGSTTPTTDAVTNTPRPAKNVEFSQDNRIVRYVAYDSSAKNLINGQPGDGHMHIYLLTRNGMAGTLRKVDGNAGGDSIKPSLDGQTKKGNGAYTPHCLAFESSSQLVKDDSSSNWSIYLYDIKTHKLTLVSPAGDTARDPVVDGRCNFITYEDGGTIYVYWIAGKKRFTVNQGWNPDQETDGKGVAYDRNGQVYWQRYQLVFNHGNPTVKMLGPERLVSVTPSGNAGNGDSEMPSANDNGTYIAFESTSTDLCDGTKEWCGTTDNNGPTMDVFRRTQPVSYTGHVPPTKDQMEMIDYDSRIENPPFQADLGSDQVRISGAGEQACFRSFGTEARQKKFGVLALTGPFMHIYFWNFPREKMAGSFTGESREGVSKDTEFHRNDNSGAFNWSCAISNRGNFIAWTSDDENQAGETNGRQIPDMFMRFMGASDEGLGGNLG